MKWDLEEWPAIAEKISKMMRTMEEDMRREELEEAEERRRDFERREFQRRKDWAIEREKEREKVAKMTSEEYDKYCEALLQ